VVELSREPAVSTIRFTAATGRGGSKKTLRPPLHESRLDQTSNNVHHEGPSASRAAEGMRLETCCSRRSSRLSPRSPLVQFSSLSTNPFSSMSLLPRESLWANFTAAYTSRSQRCLTCSFSPVPVRGSLALESFSATAATNAGI